MLDVLGAEYIKEHIRNVYKQEEKERLYREYVTDALYTLSRVSEGMRMTKRYSEIIAEIYAPKINPVEEEIAAENVKSNIIGKLNSRRKGERTNGSI